MGVFLAGLMTAGAAVADGVKCKPVLPYFCANMHIGCSGRTDLPAAGFSISFESSTARVVFESGAIWDVTIEASDSGRVFRQLGSDNWIRIDTDGQFSLRVYSGAKALMSVGQCDPD